MNEQLFVLAVLVGIACGLWLGIMLTTVTYNCRAAAKKVAPAPLFIYDTFTARVTQAKDEEYIPVLHLHRDDLEAMGYDTSRVDDETMRTLACKVGENLTYSDTFWESLCHCAEHLNIPDRRARHGQTRS